MSTPTGESTDPVEGNWNRWGTADERGAANLLTPAVVMHAVHSVTRGTVIPLAMPIRGATSSSVAQRVPHMSGRPLPQHFMSVDGGDYAAGVKTMAGDRAVADDAVVISPHGTTTHIDALSHLWRGDRLYNGHPADRVRSYGATRCGIDRLGAIVTRGIFFDLPAYLGVDHLTPETDIDRSMLSGYARDRGITVRPGDVAIIRTGWSRVWEIDPERYQRSQPGVSHDGASWLVEQDVVAIGSDNVSVGRLFDHAAGEHEDPELDVHLLTLWQHGVYLLELLELEALSAAGAVDFLFVAAPLAIEGGTASPLTPLAVL